jgi:hypothetical protein
MHTPAAPSRPAQRMASINLRRTSLGISRCFAVANAATRRHGSLPSHVACRPHQPAAHWNRRSAEGNTRSTRSPACGPSVETPRPSDGCRHRDGGWPEAHRALHAHRPAGRSRPAQLRREPHVLKEPHEMRPGNRYARQAEARRTQPSYSHQDRACRHLPVVQAPPAVVSRRAGEPAGLRFQGGRRAQASPLCRMQSHGHRQGLRVLTVALDDLGHLSY